MANVQVNDAAITALAAKFKGWQTSLIDPAISALASIPVSPGEFEDGKKLKETVASRATSLTTTLQNVKKALGDIDHELTRRANLYKAPEDDNTISATELNNIIGAVTKSLPGFMKH